MFTVLSQPNRLNIIDLLNKNPQSVNEIVYKLKLNQPQVSKHLSVLRNAGIVDVRKIKNQHIYALVPKPFKQLDSWLEGYRSLWEERFERLDKLIESDKKHMVKSHR